MSKYGESKIDIIELNNKKYEYILKLSKEFYNKLLNSEFNICNAELLELKKYYIININNKDYSTNNNVIVKKDSNCNYKLADEILINFNKCVDKHTNVNKQSTLYYNSLEKADIALENCNEICNNNNTKEKYSTKNNNKTTCMDNCNNNYQKYIYNANMDYIEFLEMI